MDITLFEKIPQLVVYILGYHFIVVVVVPCFFPRSPVERERERFTLKYNFSPFEVQVFTSDLTHLVHYYFDYRYNNLFDYHSFFLMNVKKIVTSDNEREERTITKLTYSVITYLSFSYLSFKYRKEES